MNFPTRLALSASTIALVATTALPSFVNAQSLPTDQADPRTSLIQAMVSRFHLSQTDVERVFAEQETVMQAARQAQHNAQLDTRLTNAVSQGSLTDAQKSAIIAKAKEAQAKHAEARKLSREECKKIMDAYRMELEAWLTSQGLDRSYLPLILGVKGGPGRGMMGGPRGQHGQRHQNKQNGQAGSQGFGEGPGQARGAF